MRRAAGRAGRRVQLGTRGVRQERAARACGKSVRQEPCFGTTRAQQATRSLVQSRCACLCPARLPGLSRFILGGNGTGSGPVTALAFSAAPAHGHAPASGEPGGEAAGPGAGASAVVAAGGGTRGRGRPGGDESLVVEFTAPSFASMAATAIMPSRANTRAGEHEGMRGGTGRRAWPAACAGPPANRAARPSNR